MSHPGFGHADISDGNDDPEVDCEEFDYCEDDDEPEDNPGPVDPGKN